MGGKGVMGEGQCRPNIKIMPVEGLDGFTLQFHIQSITLRQDMNVHVGHIFSPRL